MDTPQIEGVWEEGTVEGATHPADWRPTKLSQDDLDQEDLDQVLRELLDPSAKAEESSEGNSEGTLLVQGIPAGCESDLGSNLDENDLEAPSNQFFDLEDDDEEDVED